MVLVLLVALLVALLVLVIFMAYKLNKYDSKMEALEKKVTELDVRIVARIEDRLAIIESDFEDLDLACQRAVISADLSKDEQE